MRRVFCAAAKSRGPRSATAVRGCLRQEGGKEMPVLWTPRPKTPATIPATAPLAGLSALPHPSSTDSASHRRAASRQRQGKSSRGFYGSFLAVITIVPAWPPNAPITTMQHLAHQVNTWRYPTILTAPDSHRPSGVCQASRRPASALLGWLSTKACVHLPSSASLALGANAEVGHLAPSDSPAPTLLADYCRLLALH